MGDTREPLAGEQTRGGLRTARRLLRAMDRQLWVKPRLEELAVRLGVSASSLAHNFRHHFGQSPYQYAKARRLSRAAFYVKFSQVPVTEIALASGFESLEGFSRAFKGRFGVSPRAFRKAPLPQRIAQARPELERRLDIQVLEPLRVAALRCQGSVQNHWVVQWARLFRWARGQGLLDGQTRYFWLGSDPDSCGIIDDASSVHEVALTVPEDHPLPEWLREQRLSGLHAHLEATGSLERHEEVGVWMVYHWLPRSGMYLRAFEGHSEILVPKDFERAPVRHTWSLLRSSRCVHRLPVTDDFLCSDICIGEGLP